MNQREKIVQEQFLHNEKAVLKRLDQVYTKSLDDITGKVKELDSSIAVLQKAYADIGDEIGDFASTILKNAGMLTPEEAKATLASRIQSKVYQKKYQTALKKEVGDILDKMHTSEYVTVSEYLDKCYEEGFLGAMYNLQGQNIPLAFPIDQEAMVRAVQLDSPIKEGLYRHLGEDVSMLKKHITAQVSRGIATGMSYQQVAQQLAMKMKGTYNHPKGAYANAVRIARTEGHRLQVQSAMDACYKAKDMGADIVKQWDAALDARTRESHVAVDGEIRELDETFSNRLRYPGDPNGGAAEVVNCRCALKQRARAFLQRDFTKWDGENNQLVKIDADGYEEFKKKYQEALKNPLTNSDKSDTMNVRELARPIKSTEEHYKKLLDWLGEMEGKGKLSYNPVAGHTRTLSEAEIINALAGGDRTAGSCASVGLAYIGQKQGWNTLDFRDGESRRFFSSSFNLHTLSQVDGLKVLRAEGASSITVGNRLLKMCESGKEYYLCVGRHTSIVRKNADGVLQYLELQSATKSGWTNFNGNPRFTLKSRFGCTQTSSPSAYYDFMIDLNESNFGTNDFKSLLGYINTAEKEQRKGSNGTIK